MRVRVCAYAQAQNARALGPVVTYPRGNVTEHDVSVRRVTKPAQESQIYPKGNAMSTANLSLADLTTEAAQLQYRVDFESEYLTPTQLDRIEKRIVYLCKLIAKAERSTYRDTVQ